MATYAPDRVTAWRQEAAAARAVAAGFQDPEAQRSMLEVASAYDMLARLEEAATADGPAGQQQ